MSTRKATVSFKVTPQDKGEIAQRAAQLGLSVSEYCSMRICDLDGESVDFFSRGQSVLSQDDLDLIAARVRSELEVMNFESEAVRDNRQEAAIESDLEEEIIRNSILDQVQIQDSYKEKLSVFVAKSAEAQDLTEEEVISRMLTYAYSEMIPAKVSFFDSSYNIGDINDEIQATIFSTNKHFLENE